MTSPSTVGIAKAAAALCTVRDGPRNLLEPGCRRRRVPEDPESPGARFRRRLSCIGRDRLGLIQLFRLPTKGCWSRSSSPRQSRESILRVLTAAEAPHSVSKRGDRLRFHAAGKCWNRQAAQCSAPSAISWCLGINNGIEGSRRKLILVYTSLQKCFLCDANNRRTSRVRCFNALNNSTER
eukprot:gene24389-biopygen23891